MRVLIFVIIVVIYKVLLSMAPRAQNPLVPTVAKGSPT